MSSMSCELPKTKAEKNWPYTEYYVGQIDKDDRKNGEGKNYFSGAKSLEWYTGHMVRDTMHGEGDYRWRYLGPNGTFVTYEGHFYNNQLHGYGSMSYDDGRVFKGIFHGNMRWGPGIEFHPCCKEDVGLWSGRKLIRLCWRPDGPCIAPDFISSNIGREVVKPYRDILSTHIKTMGEINSALELLKRYGAKPLDAVDKWSKLHPKHCTDLSSALCPTEIFEHEYYKDKMYTLEEGIRISHSLINITEHTQEQGNFYTWNKSGVVKHMMKHCYRHESQRKTLGLNLAKILSGPRKLFRRAGRHEIDSRTLLMASYLGHISQVTQIIIENGVHPDVADIQGNTALMYATCGEQTDVINFLVSAGVDVNSYNDSCCTPLGIGLIKLVCATLDIPPNDMLQVLVPPVAPIPPSIEELVSEWIILRILESPNLGGSLGKSPSKVNRNLSSKGIKSMLSLKEQPGNKKKSDVPPPKVLERTSEEDIFVEQKLYHKINHEYFARVNDIYQCTSTNPLQYIFEFSDIVKELDVNEEDHKKLPDKNPKKIVSKVLKEATKPSKDAMWQNEKDENKSIDSEEKQKRDTLAHITAAIFELLSNGADPKLVKCPQPALVIGIVSNSVEVIRHLICFGADVNEVYPEIFGYTALDIAISRPLTYDNLEIIKVLLEHGADTDHRIMYGTDGITDTGPTLLHAAIAKRTDNEFENEICRQLIELLIDYNCPTTGQFKGRSAIDIAMSKSMDIFEIFVKNPKTNLNSVINYLNQSVLVKMFYLPFFKTFPSTERMQKITDLLLFGANPLIECYNENEKYGNVFVFAKRTLNEIEGIQTKPTSATGTSTKQDPKSKKVEKPKRDDKMFTKSMGKVADDLGEYKQTLELVTECARILHIRWLQAKLVKELIDIIKKYRHRHWNMILKELKHKKKIGLWLTSQRCLEIWNFLSSTKKKVYSDHCILKHLLMIVQFCVNRIKNVIPFSKALTTVEKDIIEKNVNPLLYDNKGSEGQNSELLWKRCYVKPELIRNDTKMFNVCFECAMPVSEDKIICISCKLVSFCSFECIELNINRVNCHPCSNILKYRYFSTNNDKNVQD